MCNEGKRDNPLFKNWHKGESIIILLLISVITQLPSIKTAFAHYPPDIDGVLEKLWVEGDSGVKFYQLYPDNGKLSNESTVIYVLHMQKIFM